MDDLARAVFIQIGKLADVLPDDDLKTVAEVKAKHDILIIIAKLGINLADPETL